MSFDKRFFVIMSKKRDQYIAKLINVAMLIADKAELVEQRTKGLQQMAVLAKAGQKDTPEFKQLERLYKQPSAFDISTEMVELRNIVKQLRKC
jgi:predicted HTH transcriptional regulator